MNLSCATDLAPPVTGNRLLASLPAGDLEHFCLLLERIKVIAGDVLCEPGQEITHIYFPGDSLISPLAVAEGRMTLEIGSVEREGMIGAAAALCRNVAQVRVVQRSGSASRIGRATFCAQFCKTESLQRLLQRYTDAVLAQAIQIATCSRFHLLEAPLVRFSRKS